MFYSHLHTKMDPPYNVHFTYNYVQCKPNAPIDPYSADRGSGVVFSIASGFLRQKTDLVKTKEVAVTSVLILMYSAPNRTGGDYTVIYSVIYSCTVNRHLA